MDRKRLLLIVVFLLVVIAANWSLLRPGLFYIHDFVHAARIAEMSRILADGQFPPRWSSNFGFGYGMPLFEFYAPLPYIIGAALYWMSLPMEVIIKLLFFLTSLLTAWGAFLLGKRVWNSTTGVFVAAAITLAPYRAVNLFVRGALSEAVGMMTFPWILYALYRIIYDEEKAWWIVLAISVAVLFLSHNLSALLFLPVSVLFALGLLIKKSHFSKKNLRSQLWPLIKGYGIGTLLAAFYIFPSLLEKQFTKVDEYIVGNYFDYAVHFVGIRQFLQENWGYGGSAYGPHDTISFFLGYGQIAAVGLGGLISLFYLVNMLWKWKTAKLKKELLWSIFMGLLLLLTLFMTHGKSAFIWDAISPLRYVQFPWRFISVAAVLLALFAAQVISLIPAKKAQNTLLIILTAGMILLNWQYFAPSEYLAENETYYYTDPIRIQSEMSYTLPDYIPRGLDANLPPTNEPLVDEYENVTVLRNNSTETEISTNFSENETVIFTRADYPGWEVYIDENRTAKRVTREGLIGVQVPTGEHQVLVQLTKTPVRQNSDILSAIGLVFLVFFATLEYRRSRGLHGNN